jgi:hypothetical protein
MLKGMQHLLQAKAFFVKYFILKVGELGYWSELDHCILTIMDVSYQ